MQVRAVRAGLVLAIVLFGAAQGQQIIPKGSWVLSIPASPTTQAALLGVFKTPDSCSDGFKRAVEIAGAYYEAALKLEKTGYIDPTAAAMNGPPSEAQARQAYAVGNDNYLIDQTNNSENALDAIESATCAQQ